MPRGRKPLVDGSTQLCFRLPEALLTRLSLILFSSVEGRVPHGAYQRFLVPLIEEELASDRLDLAPFLGSLPGEAVVKSTPTTIARLRALLETR